MLNDWKPPKIEKADGVFHNGCPLSENPPLLPAIILYDCQGEVHGAVRYFDIATGECEKYTKFHEVKVRGPHKFRACWWRLRTYTRVEDAILDLEARPGETWRELLANSPVKRLNFDGESSTE
jgi:hypothetical protein